MFGMLVYVSKIALPRYADGARACEGIATVTPNPDCANCVDKCRVNPAIPNDQACWNLKWYCHDPVAIGIYDIRE